MHDQKPIALVTGATDGIGWATAQTFSAAGYRVALIDLNEEKARLRADELGADHVAYGCDVAKEANVRFTFERLSNLDVWTFW